MPLRMLLLRVDTVDVFREASLDLRVLRGLLGIVLASEVEIVVAAVRTRHVGDVPDGIGASTVEHRTTTQGIGEAAHILRAITLQGVAVVALPRIGSLIPHGRIERDVRRLGLPLRRDVFVGNGIEQARAIDADGGLQTDGDIVVILRGRNLHILAIALHIDGGIVGRSRDRHLGIGEVVAFTIVKLVSPLVRIVLPVYPDLRLVDRSLERLHGRGLGHTSHRADVGIGLLVVDDEEVAIALLRGRIGILARTMSVAWVAVVASRAHVHWAQAAEGTRGVGIEVFLEKVLTLVEGRHHTRVLHSQGRLFVGGGRVVGRGAQLTSGEVIFRIVYLGSIANLPRKGIGRIVGARGDSHGTQQEAEIMVIS